MAEEEKKDKAKKPTKADMEKEIAEEKDKYLRLLAEFDNFRKRTKKEKEALYSDSVCDTASSFLPLMDNLIMAKDAKGDENSIKEGIELVLKQFENILKELKVEEIPTDIPFDPNLHNAVMHTEDAEKGEGEIIAVFQKGYKMGDRIIRHAMVSVAN